MAHTLSGLILASLQGPASAGKSFRNHVTAAGNGVGMVGYKLNGWDNWVSEGNEYSANTIYPSGKELAWDFNIDDNSHWVHIRPASFGAAIDEGDGAEAFVREAVYDDIASGGYIKVEIVGKTGDPGFFDDLTLHISMNGDQAGGTYNVPIHQYFPVKVARRGFSGGGGWPPWEKPFNLDATGGDAQCGVTWSNTSPEIWAIRLRLDYWTGSAWSEVQSSDRSAGQTSYTFSGITTAGDYRVRGTYINAYGESSAGYNTSDTVSVTVTGGSAPTETPDSVSAGTPGGNSVSVGWNNTNTTDTIEVVYWRDGSFFSSHQLPANSTSDSDSGFGGGVEVIVEVYYYNGYGQGPSAFSSPVFP